MAVLMGKYTMRSHYLQGGILVTCVVCVAITLIGCGRKDADSNVPTDASGAPITVVKPVMSPQEASFRQGMAHGNELAHQARMKMLQEHGYHPQ